MQTVLSDSEVRFLEQMTVQRRLSGRDIHELSAINCQENPIPGLPSLILTSQQDGMATACFYLRESEEEDVPLIACGNGDQTFWGYAGLIQRTCKEVFPNETLGKTMFVQVLQAGVQLPRLLGIALKKLLNIDVQVLTAVCVGVTWILDPDEREGLAARGYALGVRCGQQTKIRAHGQLDQGIDNAVELLRSGLKAE